MKIKTMTAIRNKTTGLYAKDTSCSPCSEIDIDAAHLWDIGEEDQLMPDEEFVKVEVIENRKVL